MKEGHQETILNLENEIEELKVGSDHWSGNTYANFEFDTTRAT
jgi:hypothetical protein